MPVHGYCGEPKVRGHARTTRIGTLIHEQSLSQEIKREVLNDGMLTLREYGIKEEPPSARPALTR